MVSSYITPTEGFNVVSEFLDITRVRKTLCLTTKALFLTLRAPELSGHLLKHIKCNVLAIAVTCPDRPLVLTQTHGAVSHISDEHEYSKIKYLNKMASEYNLYSYSCHFPSTNIYSDIHSFIFGQPNIFKYLFVNSSISKYI